MPISNYTSNIYNESCSDGGEQTSVWGVDRAARILHLTLLLSTTPGSWRSVVTQLHHSPPRVISQGSRVSWGHVYSAQDTCPPPWQQCWHQWCGQLLQIRIPLLAPTPAPEIQTSRQDQKQVNTDTCLQSKLQHLPVIQGVSKLRGLL